MSDVIIAIESEVVAGLRVSPQRAEEELRLELAVQLVRERLATAAQGARIARLTRLEFLSELGRRQVSICGSLEEVASDLEALDKASAP